VSGLREGSKVSYIGDGHDGRQLGDHGRLLVRSGRQGHVKWASGEITPHDLEDLAPAPGAHQQRVAAVDPLADSLEVGLPQVVSVRATYEIEGAAGVLNALATTGSLGGFSEIANEVMSLVATRVRSDPGIAPVLAQLDDDEAAELVTTATHALLRDAFGDADG
jgi:hypothetical protein